MKTCMYLGNHSCMLLCMCRRMCNYILPRMLLNKHKLRHCLRRE